MAVAVNDKLSGTINLKLADGTFFSADCQLTVTGAGNVPTPEEEAAAAKAAAAAGATGATGATGAHAGATGAAGAHGQAAGHHEAKK